MLNNPRTNSQLSRIDPAMWIVTLVVSCKYGGSILPALQELNTKWLFLLDLLHLQDHVTRQDPPPVLSLPYANHAKIWLTGSCSKQTRTPCPTSHIPVK